MIYERIENRGERLISCLPWYYCRDALHWLQSSIKVFGGDSMSLCGDSVKLDLDAGTFPDPLVPI